MESVVSNVYFSVSLEFVVKELDDFKQDREETRSNLMNALRQVPVNSWPFFGRKNAPLPAELP